MDKRQRAEMTKSAGTIGSMTLLSRIFGFLRDAAMAWFFGAGFVSDAFLVAFRIPNMLRKLYSEGTLNLAFVPVFVERLTSGGEQEASVLARSAFWSVLLALSLATAAGMLFSPALVRLMAPGFAESPEKMALAVSLTRMLFPFVVFIGLSSVCMGVLNSFGHFFTPAASPFIINVSMISAIFFLSPRMGEPVQGLAVGVIAGGFLQLVFQMPYLAKCGMRIWKWAAPFQPAFKKAAFSTVPAVLGASVFQANVLIDTFIASSLSDGAISCLYYADRLVQFPLGVFAMTAAIALLPSLSREAAVKNYEGLAESLVSSLGAILFVTVPAMAGLIILREPIVSLLFERGEFGLESVRSTADALLYYATGLWAYASARIAVSTFYALRDARTPFRLALLCIFVKAILSLVLVGFLDYKGLALATSAASVLNLVALARALQAKLGGLVRWKRLAFSIIRTAAATATMTIGVLFLKKLAVPSAAEGFFALAAGLFGCIFFAVAVFFVSSVLFKSKELGAAVDAAKKIGRNRA